MLIKTKLPGIKTSIFSVMSALAKEHDAINLSQGFPDFDISPELVELVTKHMQAGHNQYAPMSGVLPLRENISKKINKLYSHYYDEESEITVTAGATQAIFTAITASIKENDEVIIFDPAYDCYVPAVVLNGGIPVHIGLDFPDYTIDWEYVRRCINSRTKMIILNTPHNPSGAILNKDDLNILAKLVEGTDIVILSDEVYEHIVFDNQQHHSVIRHPELRKRSFVTFSFGKTFHATGWKMGYCVAPAELMKEFRKIHQFVVFSVNTPIQYALAEFMQHEANYNTISGLYEEKRNLFLSNLKSSRFIIKPAQGTYFQNLCYKNISDNSDVEFAKELTIKHGIASIPVSVFYHDKRDQKVLRFCFAKKEKTIKKAAEILCQI